MAERDILKSVKARLSAWQSEGVVLHFDRINSGKMQINGRWVQLASAGTSDLIAYIKTKDNRYALICWVYFIEVKVKGGKQRDSQKQFEQKFLGIYNVVYQLVTHPDMVDETIERITNHYQNKLDSIDL